MACAMVRLSHRREAWVNPGSYLTLTIMLRMLSWSSSFMNRHRISGGIERPLIQSIVYGLRHGQIISWMRGLVNPEFYLTLTVCGSFMISKRQIKHDPVRCPSNLRRARSAPEKGHEPGGERAVGQEFRSDR